jgi:hypothetical protein
MWVVFPHHSTNEKNRLLPLCSYPSFSFCPIFVNNIHTAILGLVISGFRFEVDENCTLQGHYTASSGNSAPTFRDNLSAPSSRVNEALEDWTERLSRNVGKRPPLYATYFLRTGQISSLGIVDTKTVLTEAYILLRIKIGGFVYNLLKIRKYFLLQHIRIFQNIYKYLIWFGKKSEKLLFYTKGKKQLNTLSQRQL